MHQDYLKVLTRENAELGYGEVSGSGVNLRSGPSTTYGKVAVASQRREMLHSRPEQRLVQGHLQW